MKTYIIYLAAGNSKRFPDNKLLYRFGDKPLYRHTFDQLTYQLENIIVVTQYREIQSYVMAYPGVSCVLSQECQKGLSYSIKKALELLKDVPRPFEMIFVVADQPYLTLASIRRLIKTAHDNKVKLATLQSAKRPGNPTLFHSDYFDELMQLKDDQGGRVILKRHASQVLTVSVDDIELYDIDYFNDLK